MLIYREDARTAATAAELARLRGHAACLHSDPTAETALDILIGAGELEAGLCDALCPERDDVSEETARVRRVSLAAADVYLRALAGESPDPSGLLLAIDAVGALHLPGTVSIRPSEGYAYYALYPETYAEAARRFRADRGAPRVVVIGIRSIGTSLSAIVAAALGETGEVASCTVRPHGHPFDRRIGATASLREWWRREHAAGAVFAIVDEGPGLSGSSFASVVSGLNDVEVPDSCIALFPSWDPDPAVLRSDTARHVWSRCRRYTSDAAGCGITPQSVFGITGPVEDWSAGRWRTYCAREVASWPAVQPQHERWKVCVRDERRVVKFCGLGHYGAAALDRAARLAACGLIDPPLALRHGFIDLPLDDGSPALPPFSAADADLVGAYIGRAAAEFGIAEMPADGASVAEMVRINTLELLGEAVPAHALEGIAHTVASAPASVLDGRMLAHEWIRTTSGLRKTDALDHGRDHFFPGPQNPAWDLAAAVLELRFDDGATRRLIEAYAHASGDRDAAGRLHAYLLAYAAFRGGYAAVAAESCGDRPEARRFARVRAGMAAALRARLSAPSAP